MACAALETAHEHGVSFIDTAPYYGFGLSEKRIGQSLRAALPREQLVLSTKVGRLLHPLMSGETPPDVGFADPLPFRPHFDYSASAVRRSVEESCDRLDTERLDIVLVHDIGAQTHGREAHPGVLRQVIDEALPTLNDMKQSGTVGAIGLGVNECAVCLDVLAVADLDCLLLAGRYTLLEQSALDTLLPECTRRSVSVIIGGPFNSGLLASRPHPGAPYNYEQVDPVTLSRALRLHDICDAYGVPLQAAALRFPLAHPNVVSVIPGMRSPDEVRQNVRNAGWSVPDGLWRDLRSAGLLHPEAPVPQAA